jgi:hypothetical protein
VWFYDDWLETINTLITFGSQLGNLLVRGVLSRAESSRWFHLSNPKTTSSLPR